MGAGASTLIIDETLFGKFHHQNIGNLVIEKEKVVFCKDDNDATEKKEFPIEWINPFTFHVTLEGNVMLHSASCPDSLKSNDMHAELWVFSPERDGYFQINECFGNNTIGKAFSTDSENSTFFKREVEDEPAEKDTSKEAETKNSTHSNLVGKFKGFMLNEGEPFVSMDDGSQLKIEWINPFVFLSSNEVLSSNNNGDDNNDDNDEIIHEKGAWIFSFMLDSYLEIDSKENCVTNAEREPNKVHKRITFCKNYEMTPDEEIENNLQAAADVEVEGDTETIEQGGDVKDEKVENSTEVPQTEMDMQTEIAAPDSIDKSEDGPLVLEQKGKANSTINFEKKNTASNGNICTGIPNSEINTGA